MGLIPGLGRSLGEGNGNPLHYSCLGNPTVREAWQATVRGVARVRHNLVTKRQEQTGWNDTPALILQSGVSSLVAPPEKNSPQANKHIFPMLCLHPHHR